MNQLTPEQLEAKNRRYMVVGIVVLMVVVFGFWLFNFRDIVNPRTVTKEKDTTDNLSWPEIKSQFDITMKQIGGKLNALDKGAVAATTSSSTKIQNLIDDLESQSASTTASSSASSSDAQAAEIKSRLGAIEDQLDRQNP